MTTPFDAGLDPFIFDLALPALSQSLSHAGLGGLVLGPRPLQAALGDRHCGTRVADLA
jgi:hypothetical protein